MKRLEHLRVETTGNTAPWALLAGFSVGLALYEIWLGRALPAFVLANKAYPGSRGGGVRLVLGAIFLAAVLLVLRARRQPRPAGLPAWIRPLSLAFLVPPLLSRVIWNAAPLFCFAVALAVAAALAIWLVPEDELQEDAQQPVPASVRIVLAALIVGYTAFVGVATLRQHELLETRAFDMGVMENVVWHTSQGRLFESSLEGRNHLGVHTSLIFLLVAGIYRVLPHTGTLLACQAAAVGIAAWPLFLLVRFLLKSSRAGLLAAFLYLLHPAVQGASFYDFHELAFAPLFFLSALYGLLRGRPVLLWSSTALLLTVKEDCAILACALGFFALLEKHRREGVALVVAGVAAYAVLQGIVVPHFAGGESSYAWYYADMIPAGEGPESLLRTLLLNPLYSLRLALTGPKALYVLQTTGPVLLLCLFGLRGQALIAYGLATSVLATREHLFELGFQYSFLLVPAAFAGAFVELARVGAPGALHLPGMTKRRALFAMTAVSLLFAFHNGMLAPGARFKGGFRIVDFGPDPAKQERLREVTAMAGLIPDTASVTASETLVPHVARRLRVQTLRYAAARFGRDYDYFFILKADLDPGTAGVYRYVLDSVDYELVRDGRDTLLYRRR